MHRSSNTHSSPVEGLMWWAGGLGRRERVERPWDKWHKEVEAGWIADWMNGGVELAQLLDNP